MKKNISEYIKREKGITMITLVVTIVVLTIVGAISVSSMNTGGINQVKEDSANVSEKENTTSNEIDKLYNNLSDDKSEIGADFDKTTTKILISNIHTYNSGISTEKYKVEIRTTKGSYSTIATDQSTSDTVTADNLTQNTAYIVKITGNTSKAVTEKSVMTDNIEAAKLKMTKANGEEYTSDTWTNNYVNVELEASKYTSTYASILDSVQTVAKTTAKTQINKIGTTKLRVTTTDGTSTVTKDYRIMIDDTKPTVHIAAKKGSVSGDDYTPDTWTNQSIYVAPASTDSLSGIKSTNIFVDRSKSMATSQMITSEGTHTASIETVDYSENTANSETITIKIDKTAPKNTAPVATQTTKSIKVTNKQTDASSGIDNSSIQYALKTINTWSDWQASDTFDNLTQSTTYQVKTKVTDNAGNSAESAETTVTTDKVTDLTNGNTTFTFTPSTWTKGNVSATISTTVAGFTLQYQVGSTTGTWTNYTGALTITENTTIYARLFDGLNVGGTATGTVSNIDRTAPTAGSIEVKNLTSSGYDVYVYGVADSQSGVNRVQFPTWTDSNGQDDIAKSWQTNSKISGTDQGNGTWYFRVNIADHNNENGLYHTHVYLYDNVENTTCKFTKDVTVPSVKVSFNINYLSNNTYYDNYNLGRYWTYNCSLRKKSSTLDQKFGSISEFEFDSTSNASTGIFYSPNPNTALTSGNTYTWSVYIKTSSDKNLKIGHEQAGKSIVQTTSEWKKYSNTFVANDNKYKAFVFYTNVGTWSAGDKIYVADIQLEPGDGSSELTSISKQCGTTYDSLTTPTRTGYTFEGWYTDPIEGTKIEATSITPDSDVTYYAHWIDNTAPSTTAPTAASTTNSITVTNKQADNGRGSSIIQYALKTGTTWGDWQTSATFSNLAQDTEYKVKTEDTDRAGNTSESEETTIKTLKISDLTSSNTTITATPSTWTNGDVAATITTTATLNGAKLQYQLGSTTGTWTDYSSALTITDNTTIYARLYDGVNAGGTTYKAINNIDKDIPSGSLSTSLSEKTINYTIDSSDTTSGIDVNNSLYTIDTTADLKGTDSSNWSGATKLTTNNVSGNKTETVDGEYYVHVLLKDNAGNAKELISSSIVIETVTLTVSSTSTGDAYPDTLKVEATSSINGIKFIELPDGSQIEGNSVKDFTTTYNTTINGPLTFKAVSTNGKTNTLNFNEVNVQNFETEWTTTAANTKITFPVYGKSNIYIDYGDGSKEKITDTFSMTSADGGKTFTGNCPTHTYASAGTYVVKISGACERYLLNDSTEQYLTKLNKWGCLENTYYVFGTGYYYDTGNFLKRAVNLVGNIPSCNNSKSFEKIISFHSTFDGCSGLTGSIPTGLFDNTPNVTDFTDTFASCHNLTGSIPTGLFDNNPKVTDFTDTFYECYNLTGSIPTELFDKNPNVTYFGGTFWDCTGLTGSIPTGLFANNPNVTDFSYTFYRCSGLTGSIPTGLFANNPNVTNFNNTFDECHNLTGSIPTGLFDKNPNVTRFMNTFEGCHNLTGSIPTGLFDKNLNVTDFSGTFSSCHNLTSIPTGLFNNNPNVTDFIYTFNGCENLTGSIPTGLFDKNPNVTDFEFTFGSCSGLTGSIPTGLFANNPNVTDFRYTFWDCTGITGSIPIGLFDKNPNVTNFSCTFYGCSGLTGSIPIGLFDKNPNVTNFSFTFCDCYNLTGSIPTGLFANNPNVTDFNHMFDGCSGLTGSIPIGLFDKNPNVTNFSFTFGDCGDLTGSIPTGLFDNNPNVTDFGGTFDDCGGLTGSIPTGLFDNNPNVTDFAYTFQECSGLTGSIPTGLFDNNPKATSFNFTFDSCSNLTGAAPELWTRTNATYYESCFRECTNLTNYSTIPTDWK